MDREAILKKVGLDVLGFCSARPLEKEKAYLLDRQAHFGLCKYEGQRIEERLDPSLHYSPVKSILVFGINTKTRPIQLKKGQGLLAGISRIPDYHTVLKEAGNKLCQLLKLEDQAKLMVDSHPLMERAFAQRAGLGYIGENTALIHPVYGTYLALGLILTEKTFPYDGEAGGTCGSCKLCIKACPGGALKGGGVLDPMACLSYKTQSLEEGPRHLGPRLYGCDVCQEVCPKNKHVPLTSLDQVLKEGISKEEIQDLSNREFKKKYGHLTGAWRGKKQWMENFKSVEAYWARKSKE